jgi:hypothetical protein
MELQSYSVVAKLISFHLFYRTLNIKINKAIILPVVYDCKTWFFTLREEHKLQESENSAQEGQCTEFFKMST